MNDEDDDDDEDEECYTMSLCADKVENCKSD